MAVAFALVMLAAYVVYSQKQQNRTVAPGSKVLSPPETSGKSSGQSNGVAGSPATSTSTNNAYSFSEVVASSSKSISPVVKVPPRTPPPPPPASPPSDDDWIATMTSKFGRVFDRSITQSLPDIGVITIYTATNSTEMSARKSLAATNTPPKKASP
jgi:hypothetical protein